MDNVEREYELFIKAYLRKGEDDKAYELQCGLNEYKKYYKL